MNFQTVEALERRRRNIRIILFIIIGATLPFYCAGFLLWGTAPRASTRDLATATFTPIGGNLTATNTRPPTNTPLFRTSTPGSPLGPTPLQFIPPTRIPATATSVFIPTSTLAPTLTPYPTDIPQPTNTPVPAPTNTPIPLPSDTPVPTNTDAPPPTDVPLLPATDTPVA